MAEHLRDAVNNMWPEVEQICRNALYEPINSLLLDIMKQYTCVRYLNMAVCDITDHMSNRTAKVGISLGKDYFNGTYVSVGSHGEGLGFLANDRDTICINNDCTVVVPDENTEPTEDDLLVDTKNCYQGYCRLKFHRLNRRNVGIGNDVKQIGREYFLKSSSMLNRFKHGNSTYDSWATHGPALSHDTIRQDFVLALKCRNPKSLLEEYCHRKRVWPTKEILKIMEDVSVTVVAAVHHNSIDSSIEYRFSFAQAERYLIRTLNTNQFVVYAFLKQIKPSLERRVSNSDVIRSYYIKTVLLWVCEILPEAEWSEGNFIRNCLLCLKILKFCYLSGRLPSLFIPQNNLLHQFDKQTLEGARSLITSFTEHYVFLKNVLASLCGESHGEFEHVFQRMCTRFTAVSLRDIFRRSNTSSYPLENISQMIECETLSYISIDTNSNDRDIQIPVLTEVVENIHNLLKEYPLEYRLCIKTLFMRYLGDYIHTICKSLRAYHDKCLALYNESVDLCMPVSLRNDQHVSGTTHISLFHYLNGNATKACEALLAIEKPLMQSNILFDMFYAADVMTMDRLSTDPFLFDIFRKYAQGTGDVFYTFQIKYLSIAMYIISKSVSETSKRKIIQFKRKTSSYIACLNGTGVDAVYPETMLVLLETVSNFNASLHFNK